MGTIKTHTAKAAMATSKKAVPAVMQHDSDSCGWATTLWLLKKNGIPVPPYIADFKALKTLTKQNKS